MTITAPPGRGLDEAWDRAPALVIKQAGFDFIIGYVSEDSTGKNITAPEIKDALMNGLDVCLVYEYSPMAAINGSSRGFMDGVKAAQYAHNLGAPNGVCIYAAVDFDAVPSQMSHVVEYLAAFSGQCHRANYAAGVYGSYDVVNAALNNAVADFGWQTYAWSGGKWDPRAQIRQTLNGQHVAGHDVDFDTATTFDYGQWKGHQVAIDITADQWSQLLGGVRRTEELVSLGLLANSDVADSRDPVTGQDMPAAANNLRAKLDTILSQGQSVGTILSQLIVAIGTVLDAFKAGSAPSEQALLDLWTRVAVALEKIAGTPGTTPTQRPYAPPAEGAAIPPLPVDSQP
jgi:hypothetical protein